MSLKLELLVSFSFQRPNETPTVGDFTVPLTISDARTGAMTPFGEHIPAIRDQIRKNNGLPADFPVVITAISPLFVLT